MEVNQKVKDFFMKLGEDDQLRGKLEAAAKRQDLAECALLSREAGFDFTRADLECLGDLATAYQNGELSDAQLELVSGGCLLSGLWIAAVIALVGSVAIGAAAGTVGGFTGVLIAAKT
jgi:predicted ribosomally synthesized peptide with nif11-like leader